MPQPSLPRAALVALTLALGANGQDGPFGPGGSGQLCTRACTETTSVALDFAACAAVTALDDEIACEAVNKVAPGSGSACTYTPVANSAGTCTETASVAADRTACLAITGSALEDSSACEAVMTAADDQVRACTWHMGFHYGETGFSLRCFGGGELDPRYDTWDGCMERSATDMKSYCVNNVPSNTGGCESMAALDYTADWAPHSNGHGGAQAGVGEKRCGVCGPGTYRYTPLYGTCAETASTPVQEDTLACAAVSGADLETETACEAVEKANAPGDPACTYTAPTYSDDSLDYRSTFDNCVACPAGKSKGIYNVATSSRGGETPNSLTVDDCDLCAAGKYAEAGSAECTDCEAGKYLTTGGTAAADCISCPTDTTSDAGSDAETDCEERIVLDAGAGDAAQQKESSGGATAVSSAILLAVATLLA